MIPILLYVNEIFAEFIYNTSSPLSLFHLKCLDIMCPHCWQERQASKQASEQASKKARKASKKASKQSQAKQSEAKQSKQVSIASVSTIVIAENNLSQTVVNHAQVYIAPSCLHNSVLSARLPRQ